MPKDDSTENKVFNLKAVSTWNVWNVPLGGDFPFHRHKSWRIFNDMNLSNLITSNDKQINNQNELSIHDGLVVSCFQEAFSWWRAPYVMNRLESKSAKETTKTQETTSFICSIGLHVITNLVCLKFVWPSVPKFMIYDTGSLLLNPTKTDTVEISISVGWKKSETTH